jgi:hypothetical protein
VCACGHCHKTIKFYYTNFSGADATANPILANYTTRFVR